MNRRSFLQGVIALFAARFAPAPKLSPQAIAWGPSTLRDLLRGNREFRRLAMPYVIRPGVPIGLLCYPPPGPSERTPLVLGHAMPAALEERPRARRWRGSATRLAATMRQQPTGPLVLRRSPLSDMHEAAWGVS